MDKTTFSQYAIANEPTPVFNTPDFPSAFGGEDGKSLPLDNEGLFRELEYVAFEGTIFAIKQTIDNGNYKIFNVTSDSYDYDTTLYIDSRFVTLSALLPSTREKKCPPEKDIISFLDKAVGSKYIWGGNYIPGIKKMLKLYLPSGPLSEDIKDIWRFKGCDCSGLMYEATNGFTERNTSRLINYGDPVSIAGLSPSEIKSKLKPLDMMVWKGHVIYVYDENTAIQSALSKGGVVKTDLLETIEQIMKKRKPVNDYDNTSGERFVVRRWFIEN